MSTSPDVPEQFGTGEQVLGEGRKVQAPRDWIYGFLLLGVLLGLIGSLMIAWQYHIGTDSRLIGLHFLSLNAGYVVAGSLARQLVRRIQIRSVALLGCGLACMGLIALALLAPPALPVWRMMGLAGLGLAAGLIASALLHVLDQYYVTAPAHAINLTGALFGCGCALATVVVGATYFAGSIQIEVGALAVIPLIFFLLFARSQFAPARAPFAVRKEEEKRRNALKDLRSIAAVLFSLLLFFQFGNEWVIAGWLALFLIHRLGANPVEAVLTLAIHFVALTVARLAVRKVLPHISHRRLLYCSIVTCMAGYILLSWAPSILMACIAAIVVGVGYAPIYPVLAETLDHRFSYHPSFYQGIFSIAVTGAMSAPWLVGYVDNWLGTQYVMILPALGSVAVLILALLIRLEARLMGSREGNGNEISIAAKKS